MKRAEGFVRLLYLAPPLAAAFILPGAAGRPIGAGVAFAILAAYARIAALLSDAEGFERTLLFAELLPFFAYCEALAGGHGLGPALIATAEAAAAGAALLLAESLSRLERRSSLAAVAFIAIAAGAGAAMERARPAPFLGCCAVVLAIGAYGRKRAL